MGGCHTSPVRPFVKSNAKMKSMEHWCNERPGKAKGRFVFGKKDQTINVLQKIMAVPCENHMENGIKLRQENRVLIFACYFTTLSVANIIQSR
jgi:hypothetical protein